MARLRRRILTICFLAVLGWPDQYAIAGQSCDGLAGTWGGSWSEISCDGKKYSGSWLGQVEVNCDFVGTDDWDVVSGTVDPVSKVLTAFGVSADGCGSITTTGTFSGTTVSGSYTYGYGGGGTFSGNHLFIPPPTYFTLTVSKTGDGGGTVTSTPAGINCGSDCSHLYTSGASVTLTAAAAVDSTFGGWSGCSSSTSITCVRQMNSNQVVTATFAKEKTLTLTSPNGGEEWMVGTAQTVSWSSQNVSGTVSISLHKGGVLDSTIVSNTNNDGSLLWTIPSGQAPGDDYKVVVTTDSNNTVTDSSDVAFTISAAPRGSNFPATISIINLMLE